MTSDMILPFYQALTEDVNALSAQVPALATDTLQDIRRKALERFSAIGLPTLKTEAWRYTNIQRYLKEFPYELLSTASPVSEAVINSTAIPELDCYRIVLVNGHLQADQSTLPQGKGITVGAMSAHTTAPGFVTYFNEQHHLAAESLAQLNTALFADGLYLELAANTVLDKPIHVVNVYSCTAHAFIQPRHLWILNRNAAATIIETSVHPETATIAFANSVLETVVLENAELWHYNVQQGAESFREVHTTAAQQHKDSRYHHFNFTLPNTPFTRNNLSVALNGSHTETNLNGLYIASKHQHVDNHTFMDHIMPDCNSNELYKGVLLDNANGVFTGKILVHQEAQKTNAFQQNNNLLLGTKADINSQPQLEIYADDVKCSHGFTAGQFSEESMFYLRSRGIGEDAAKALMVNAFSHDITDAVKVPALQHFLQTQIAEIMNN
ncbi:Fe-S cluster assembly protein SufD [Chitinophaga ginsengisegetis]|uniref:Fe-S cluster assembly protein SufD n=1 Tax=Chitinophaga ginsengisegetis TaxID=393003 RepID=UPI000DB94A57|nr:Fe-S cluster assembly protein SufD [Chitinophaga ginsengisegetis]MDR6571220.1 Fe-S cluster assembly protein SufD [Chitinophaga ginsengisegetis]MDR6650942.1 Fe-S cluster assembly protein SufD [Chitinophaga ginsengisegetis]MDR6657304.1 Fe-S cluster assembly protein SufD [Chitinophaga ginsengisegetis]